MTKGPSFVLFLDTHWASVGPYVPTTALSKERRKNNVQVSLPSPFLPFTNSKEIENVIQEPLETLDNRLFPLST